MPPTPTPRATLTHRPPYALEVDSADLACDLNAAAPRGALNQFAAWQGLPGGRCSPRRPRRLRTRWPHGGHSAVKRSRRGLPLVPADLNAWLAARTCAIGLPAEDA